MSYRKTITLEELPDVLDRAARHFNNLSPLLGAVKNELVESTIRRFDQGIDPEGMPWQGVSPITKAARSERQGGERPLMDTGELRASVSGYVEGDKIHIGSDKIYARIHQEGGVIRPRQARFLVIPLNAEARREGIKRLSEKGLFRPRGTRILAIREGGELRPMFWLASSVEIPARPIFGLSYDDEEIIKDIVRDFAEGAFP